MKGLVYHDQPIRPSWSPDDAESRPHAPECPVTVIPERMIDISAAQSGDALLAVG